MSEDFDDPSVESDAPLFRRIRKESPGCLVQNGDDFELGLDAFTYDHGSGCSVSIESVWEESGGTLETFVDWDIFGVAVFPVDMIRTVNSGILRDPTEIDPSHALIRVRDHDIKSQRRKHWLELRSRLREQSPYFHTAPEAA